MTNLNDVLLAMSNIPVDDPIAEIWGRGLQGGGYTVIEYTGALPITINANGEPLTDYRIYGNTEQTGTPTPENPIMPIWCGVRTDNLLPFDDKNFVISTGGSNLIVECKNGDLYMKGTATEIITTNALWKNNFAFELKAGTYYCNSPSPLGGAFGRYIKKYDDSNILEPNKYTFTITENTKCYLSFYIYNKVLDSKIELMLNAGSTPLPYEPYGYKLPILSNSTVTNIYLGEAETTRRIKKQEVKIIRVIVLGNGNMGGVSENFSANVVPGRNNAICDRALYGGMSEVGHFYVNKVNAVFIGPPTYTLDDFKYKYDGASLWCVLEEPETGVVNEPLMKISDYADTIDSTQANVQIPTFAGTTVIDYDGTTKPSEMYIKYGGKK